MRHTKIITFLLLICITLSGCNTVDQSEKYADALTGKIYLYTYYK